MSPAFATATLPAAAVAVALLVDRLAGEPPVRWHPVAWMGRLLAASQAALERLPPRRGFGLGSLAWAGAATLAALLAWILEQALWRFLQPQSGLAAWLLTSLLLGLLLKPLLAWRMLRDEVRAVEAALQHGGLAAGRARLSRLVSRRTATLDEALVRESAIETLAENLSDSVVAPLFWFAVAGLPGAALYRLANTADAIRHCRQALWLAVPLLMGAAALARWRFA